MSAKSQETKQSTGTTTNNGQTSPWSVQQPFLEDAFNSALGTYNGNSQYTPSQLNAFQQMLNYGTTNGSIPNSSAAAGAATSGAAASGIGAGLYGLANYQPNINMGQTISDANNYVSGINIPAQVKAAMQPAEEEAAYSLNPNIDANSAATGNINSSRNAIEHGLVATNLGQTAANIGAQLEGQGYTTGAGLSEAEQAANNQNALTALSGLANSGAWDLMAGTGANNGSVGQASGLFNIASQGATGENNAPFQALQNYMNIVGGQSWGNQTSGTATNTGTSTDTTNPSTMAQIGGWTNLIGSLL